VNFFAHNKDISPSCEIGGALELQLSDKVILVESAHKVLDFIELSDVASSEGSSEEAIS
jgi:hypothetical protein